MRISATPQLAPYLHYGILDDRIWVRRPFYQYTMRETLANLTTLPVVQRYRMSQILLTALQQLHAYDIFHGHLCTSNIAWEGEKAVILDHGLATASSKHNDYPDLAPELRHGSTVQATTDFYGAGNILLELFPEADFEEEYNYLKEMVSEEIFSRHSLNQAKGFLLNAEYNWSVAQEENRRRFQNSKVSNLTEVSKPIPVKAEPEPLPEVPAADEFDFALQSDATHEISASVIKISFLFLVSILVLWVYRDRIPTFFSGQPQQEIRASFDELWKTGQPSMMKLVAVAAVKDGNRIAQATIVKDVFDGNKPLKVKTELIRFVFDPSWEDRLSEEDRKLTLTLSLAGLVSDLNPDLSKLDQSNPIVLLGILGTLNIEAPVSNLNVISASKLSDLPAPFGSMYSDLTKDHDLKLSDTSVRALSHIILGATDENKISKYFSQAKNDLELFRHLRVILPLFERRPGMETTVFTLLISRSKVFAQTSRWFDDEALAGWDKIDRKDKIGILVGIPTKKELSFEQYCDLLMFPNPKVAKNAAEVLKTKFFSGKMGALLAFLSSSENHLTRNQVISIIPALGLSSKDASAYIGRWFANNPDPQSVLAMLLARSDAPKSDLFNLSAASYLANASWNANLDKLKKLTLHPEPLARTLAYSRLKKSNPKELEILKTMSLAEPDKRIRERIQAMIR